MTQVAAAVGPTVGERNRTDSGDDAAKPLCGLDLRLTGFSKNE